MFFLFFFYINIYYESKPTKNDVEVKYIPPLGATPVNSTLDVAMVITPLWLTVNMLSEFKFLIKNTSAALFCMVTAPDELNLNNSMLALDIKNMSCASSTLAVTDANDILDPAPIPVNPDPSPVNDPVNDPVIEYDPVGSCFILKRLLIMPTFR